MYKIALITGTSSGLGETIAKHLLANDWVVIGVSRGKSTIIHSCYTHFRVDISDSDSVKNLFINLNSFKFDLLINNSAVFEYQSFIETPVQTIDKIIDINLKGSMYVTKNALHLMNKNSRIIFINSVAGLEELENQSIYCASKYGLTAFAGVLGKELRGESIKVTSIHPGGINTPMWDSNKDFHTDLNKLIDPQQIADMITFICNSQQNIEYKTIKMFPDIEWHN